MTLKAWRLLFAILLGFAALGALRHYAVTLLHPWPVEYGEGVNLHWARVAGAGDDLYPDIRPDRFPWVHNPYPPLPPLLVSALENLTPDTLPFLAGRSLSLLGLALGAGAIFAWLRRRVAPGVAAVAALSWCLTPAAQEYGAMMRVDALAAGCALAAFAVTDRATRPRGFALAAALAAAAALCKPTLGAVAIVLIARLPRKRSPAAWLGAGGGMLCVAAGVLAHPSVHAASAPLQHLWTLQRLPWDGELFLQLLARNLGRLAPLAALGAAGLVRGGRSLCLYTGLALLPLLATLGVTGSDDHYFLEVTAILCMAAAIAAPRLLERNREATLALILLQGILWIPVSSPPVFTRTYGQEMDASQLGGPTPTEADRDLGRQLAAELDARDGPVLSSSPGQVLASGHALDIQVYQFGHLIRADGWPDTRLRHALATREIRMVLLKGDAESGNDPYLPADLQALVADHYGLHRVLGPWHLYLAHE